MLKIMRDHESWFAKLSIDEKKTVINAGFVWDDILQRWQGSPRAAYRLYDHVADLDRLWDELNLRPNGNVPPVVFPQQRGLIPFQHQLEGAYWAMSRRASYIAFEAGLGKTAVAPLCMNTVDGPTIIVCPSFLKLNWEDELERWLINFHHIQILNKQTDRVNPNADVYIVPDSLIHVHEFRDQFFTLPRRFKYVFVDEAHRYKSEDARRTMSLAGRREVKLGRGKTARRVRWQGFHKITDHIVNLSGTPMPNRPIELFPLISRHAPHAVNYFDKHRFGVRYCGGFEAEHGWDYTGASNLEELHYVLNRNYMLVKTKAQCLDLPERLPPKLLFIDDERGVYKQDEMRLLEKLKVSDIIRMVSEKDEAFRQHVEDMLEDKPEMGVLGFISKLRKMLGLAKVKASVRVLEQLLEEHDKLVVFCWHEEVIQEIASRLSVFPLIITGKTPMNRRHEIVKDFQNNPRFRIILANIQAAGVGITLTKSSRPIFIEPSWRWDDNEQAIDRCHRIGQDEDVQPMFLVVKNSLDHLVLNAYINKGTNIKTAIKPST